MSAPSHTHLADLSPEAHILYSSDSVVDILGYSPHEIVNRSCWDFFHPNEIPIARAAHGRGVELDKAAVLSYCQMRDKDGNWIGCEIVFTIVYDVMVGCTSIYQRGLKSQSKRTRAYILSSSLSPLLFRSCKRSTRNTTTLLNFS